MFDPRPLESISYAALRIVSGLAFAFHGIQKVFDVMLPEKRSPPDVGSQLWIGGVIELVAGLLVAFGLLTRPAAFVASGTMAVAYIQFHWKFQLDEKFFPVSETGNGGELALLYCFLFLFVTFHGPGRAAIDNLITRRR